VHAEFSLLYGGEASPQEVADAVIRRVLDLLEQHEQRPEPHARPTTWPTTTGTAGGSPGTGVSEARR
jgi:hypothetical protein